MKCGASSQDSKLNSSKEKNQLRTVIFSAPSAKLCNLTTALNKKISKIFKLSNQPKLGRDPSKFDTKHRKHTQKQRPKCVLSLKQLTNLQSEASNSFVNISLQLKQRTLMLLSIQEVDASNRSFLNVTLVTSGGGVTNSGQEWIIGSTLQAVDKLI